ncbi:chitosanase [Kribbella sp. NBC_01505]|uniref:chitosanase n=1 Tax=Kribbella sp. NBC_01505 TaxID=2903580 RepID=UPI00386DED28
MRTRPVSAAFAALALLATGLTAADALKPSSPPTSPTSATSANGAAALAGLDDPAKKDIAMQLVSSAENSSLDWRAQYKYIEDIHDGRGYTGGIIGFTSGTGDMLELVELYTNRKPNNPLASYLPALRAVNGSDSLEGLDGYPQAWEEAAQDQAFQQAQNEERDRVYFNPAVQQGNSDGVGTLGQFIYYDALVVHGDGSDPTAFSSIRNRAKARAATPADGGDETTYLHAFLDERVWAMKQEPAHEDTSRIDTAQRVFLNNGNLNLNTPLDWHVYGQPFHIS